MKPKRKLLTPILACLLLSIVILMVVASQQSGPTFTPPTLPQNNGYDKLLEAAKLVAPRTGFYSEMESEELSQIVSANKEALEMASSALENEIVVPIDWSIDPTAGGQILFNEMQGIRDLARAFMAEARWQRNSGNTTAAVESAQNAFHLGTKCSSGGLMVDYLIGIAIQGISLDEIRNIDVKNRELLESTSAAIRAYGKNAETSDEVISREKAYIESKLTGFKGWLMRDALMATYEPAEQSARVAENRVAAQQGLLLLHLALHQFHLDRGEWPDALVELPAISLSPQPLDPFSEQPFIYRRTDDGYELYSVGENKLDDGGQTDENGLQPDLVFDLIPSEQ